MGNRNAAGVAMGATVVAWAALLLFYAPRLPERVASHFNFRGEPDGWMPKAAFLFGNVGVVIFTVAIMVGAAAWLTRLPDDAINLPNKEFWLAPERRATTLRIVGDSLHWLGVATVALLGSVTLETCRANLLPEPRLGIGVWVSLVAYLVYTVFWAAALTRRFRPPASP